MIDNTVKGLFEGLEQGGSIGDLVDDNAEL
jgi:hypothetical protein